MPENPYNTAKLQEKITRFAGVRYASAEQFQSEIALAVPRYISALPAPGGAGPRRLALLGSTGSIGRSALEVIRLSPDRFRVASLAGAKNIRLLASQAAEFRPACLGLLDEKDLPALRALLPEGYAPDFFFGQPGYERLAALDDADMVLSAQVGAAGLRATCAAAAAGKIIALANKESLVLAGDLIRQTCGRSGAAILPVDSEHNAVFQCLVGSFGRNKAAPDNTTPDRATPGKDTPGKDTPGKAPLGQAPSSDQVARLILTASGGPFFGKSRDELRGVTPELALRHPNWNMGPKVTIDSATLMNKGLELIEAHHLYGLPMDRLDVLVHRESIIHSLVEFTDHSLLAQLGQPDMRLPIAFCLAWPERAPAGVVPLDLAAIGSLHFSRPDPEAFPCLNLARRAQECGRGAPVVLNAANERAVAAFLDGRMGFTDIPRMVEHCLEEHYAARSGSALGNSGPDSVEAVLALDAEARTRADAWLQMKV